MVQGKICILTLNNREIELCSVRHLGQRNVGQDYILISFH